MPPKRYFKKRGKFGGRGNKGLSLNALQKPVTIHSRSYSFDITQNTSGTGGFTTVGSAASVTHGNTVYIDPFYIGGRVYRLGGQFLQWRLLRFRATYVPSDTSSGVISTVAGNTTTPSYSNRAFAWGFSTDVSAVPSGFAFIIESGGVFGNTSRRSVLNLSFPEMKAWRWTSTTTASPSTIDLRTVAPILLSFYYKDTSTTNTQTYGSIYFDSVIQFRGTINNGLPISITAQTTQESKSNSPVIVDDDDEKQAEAALSAAIAKLRAVREKKHIF